MSVESEDFRRDIHKDSDIREDIRKVIREA